MNKPQTHFTPGPWFVDAYSLLECGSITIRDAENSRLDRHFRPKLEIAANAKLMSAAPEMFSVLVEVAEFLEELATSTEDFPLSLSIARGKVEQAIEKANYKD